MTETGPHLLSVDGLTARRLDCEPRVTLIAGAEAGLRAELWLGGANAAGGVALRAADLEGAILVDCAGEAPSTLREAAARVIPFVFPDLDAVPQRYARLLALAGELGAVLRGASAVAPPAAASGTAPRRLYVLCQQGLNRSALVSGLALRAAGLGAQETLALLRRRRPGCLTNQTYAALISGELDGIVAEPSR